MATTPAARRRTTAKAPTVPSGQIDFNLNEAERDVEYPVFKARIGDRVIEMSDPAELDYETLAGMEHPTEVLRLALSEDDFTYLMDLKLPGWKVGSLIRQFRAHYGDTSVR